MKTKIFLAVTIVLVFTFQHLYGQKNCSCDTNDETYHEPYLSGEIYLSNGEIVRNKLIKYNGLVDELFWKEPKSNNIIKLDKEEILRFHFLNFKGDTSVYFSRIKIKRSIIADSNEVFGQVVYEGSVSLFVLHTFFIERRELVYKDEIPYQKNVYTEEPVYIFSFNNNKTFSTRSLNRKSLYAFSPGNKDKIKEFLKANNIGKSINNSYLIRLTQFLSTIVNQ